MRGIRNERSTSVEKHNKNNTRLEPRRRKGKEGRQGFTT